MRSSGRRCGTHCAGPVRRARKPLSTKVTAAVAVAMASIAASRSFGRCWFARWMRFFSRSSRVASGAPAACGPKASTRVCSFVWVGPPGITTPSFQPKCLSWKASIAAMVLLPQSPSTASSLVGPPIGAGTRFSADCTAVTSAARFIFLQPTGPTSASDAGASLPIGQVRQPWRVCTRASMRSRLAETAVRRCIDARQRSRPAPAVGCDVFNARSADSLTRSARRPSIQKKRPSEDGRCARRGVLRAGSSPRPARRSSDRSPARRSRHRCRCRRAPRRCRCRR